MTNVDKDSKSWWNTLPGILTGSATLITAIGGFIVILNSNGCFNKNINKIPETNEKSSTKILIEDFNNNSNEWYLDTTDDHEVGIKNGTLYVYCKGNLTGAGMTSTFSTIDLTNYFPKYKIDLLCDFISGERESPFGFILTTEARDEYYQFNYFTNGLGNVSYIKNDTIRNISHISGAQTERRQASLSVRISGDEYKYYINNILIKEGKLKLLNLYTIRLFVSRTQLIGFKSLKITPF